MDMPELNTDAGHTGLVQVVRQLDPRLHLHVGLEDAAAVHIIDVHTICRDVAPRS